MGVKHLALYRIDRGRTAHTRSRYDRIAPLYDRLETALERRYYARWRLSLLSQVRGPRVLEIGVGTGKNLAYYPPGLSITAIDFSAHMLERAHQRAGQLQIPVDLCQMDAQQLDFPDHTFDTIVATFVFGSVPDPILGLREAARVTKSGGGYSSSSMSAPGAFLA